MLCENYMFTTRWGLIWWTWVLSEQYAVESAKQISWQPKYNTISNYNQFDSLRRYCPVSNITNCSFNCKDSAGRDMIE